jgi:hypothetical protein
MAKGHQTSVGIWLIASAGGVVLVGVFTLLFRVPAPLPTPVRPAVGPTSVQLNDAHATDRDPLFTDDATLLDLKPLFLPTRWNSGGNDISAPEPGRQFAGYSAEHYFRDAALLVHLPDSVQAPARAEDVLSGTPPGRPFLGFGQQDVPLKPLPTRGGYIEVYDSASGRLVLGETVKASDNPPVADGWEPMEFIAAVDAAGLVGPVVRTVGSGAEQVDLFFTRYLAENLKVGHRLEPGFYRISVGP